MTRRLWVSSALALLIAVVAGAASTQTTLACGGFFCQNSPIDQNAERIIFTQNGDGTISAYVQIQYTGSAPEFSWILPLPSPIGAEDVEVPEDAMAAFQELEINTDPVFIPPERPECARLTVFAMSAPMAAAEDAVEVFASGEVGPYGFDVIGSEDPEALVEWLRDHEYRVTEDMEPLIDVYVEDEAVFLAMRLLPEQGAEDVQPVKITYASERPMIPLRLTAVAANPDMAVMTWFYAEHQAVPVNYSKIEIDDTELTFNSFGSGSNYRQLMGDKADEQGGHGFITEYAMPTSELSVGHPLLQELGDSFPFVTRLNTLISPEEMTVDPVFDYDAEIDDVSNIHDLSDMTGLFDCERDPEAFEAVFPGGVSNSPATAVDPTQGSASGQPITSNSGISQPETTGTGSTATQSQNDNSPTEFSQRQSKSPLVLGGIGFLISLVVLAFGVMIVRGSEQ